MTVMFTLSAAAGWAMLTHWAANFACTLIHPPHTCVNMTPHLPTIPHTATPPNTTNQRTQQPDLCAVTRSVLEVQQLDCAGGLAAALKLLDDPKGNA
eukprot:919012-Pelagomonas_calceolata.AAC.1